MEKKNKKSVHHVTPLPIYFKVWGSLMVLTVVTVAASYIDLGGSVNILVALAIASVKAMLVMLFFMGLKYDSAENNVTIFSTFAFLAIFILLTSSDLLFRRPELPVKADPSDLPAVAVDVKSFAKATPELVAQGKALFGAQCITCHGAEGRGDGPAAGALNPKPRNFTQTEGWKNGRKWSEIFKTLTNGLNVMPSFATLKPEERMALAHYVRTLAPNAPEDSATDIAELQKAFGASKPRISIAFAMSRMQEAEAAPVAGHAAPGGSRGAQIYAQQCMACHGAGGQGGTGHVIGANPALQMKAAAFSQGHGAWKDSKGEFVRTVSEGFPGRGMPGFATFTSAEWDSLYQYVKSLR